MFWFGVVVVWCWVFLISLFFNLYYKLLCCLLLGLVLISCWFGVGVLGFVVCLIFCFVLLGLWLVVFGLRVGGLPLGLVWVGFWVGFWLSAWIVFGFFVGLV